jgi:hypothetical protein
LVKTLREIEGSPWAEWKGRTGFTPNVLAQQLDCFQIAPRTLRVAEVTKKGYRREQFEDAWARYAPSDPAQRHSDAAITSYVPPALGQDPGCDVSHVKRNSFSANTCDVVPAQYAPLEEYELGDAWEPPIS